MNLDGEAALDASPRSSEARRQHVVRTLGLFIPPPLKKSLHQHSSRLNLLEIRHLYSHKPSTHVNNTHQQSTCHRPLHR